MLEYYSHRLPVLITPSALAVPRLICRLQSLSIQGHHLLQRTTYFNKIYQAFIKPFIWEVLCSLLPHIPVLCLPSLWLQVKQDQQDDPVLKLTLFFVLDQWAALTPRKTAGHWKREAMTNWGSWRLVVRSV